MTRRALAAALAAGATVAWALPDYREGPPTGHTGGFGEPLCAECHFGAPLNDDAGSLGLDAPPAFQPGQAYRLVVRLQRPDLAAGGFQLAVRFADGGRAGEQAGALHAVDRRVAVTVDPAGGVAYAHQTGAGAGAAGGGATAWAVRWTAPDTAADVVIHVAANAANDDASEFGDFIYADSARVAAAR